MANLNVTTQNQSTFKKAQNKSLSDINKQYYEEAVGSAFLSDGTDVFTSSIPFNDTAAAIIAGVAADVADYTMTEDNTVAAHKAWQVRTTPGNLTSALKQNWIPPRYGVTFSARFFNDNGGGGQGPEIASSDASAPFFDNKAGTLYFDGTTAGLTFPIHIKGYQYTGSTASGGGGSSPWTQGTGVVYLNTLTDKVGIGMNNPAYPLDVLGAANTSTTYNIGGVPFVARLPTFSGHNTAVGEGPAGIGGTISGSDNTLIGYGAGAAIGSGYDNTIIGSLAGGGMGSGNNNVIIGFRALPSSNNQFNVCIGESAGYTSTGSYNIFLGRAAGYNFTSESYRLAIGIDQFSVPSLIGGNMSTGLVGINTDTSASTLQMNQNAVSGSVASAMRVNTGIITNIPVGQENTTIRFDVAAYKTWDTGTVPVQREINIGQPVYLANAASSMTFGITAEIIGSPFAYTNMDIGNSIGLCVGDIFGWLTSSTGNTFAQTVVMPSIVNGIGNVASLTGLNVSAGGAGTVNLGDQTADLGTYYCFSIDGTPLSSTTNTRTITGVAASWRVSGPPTNAGNVIFAGGRYSTYIDSGTNYFGGITQIGAAASSSGLVEITNNSSFGQTMNLRVTGPNYTGLTPNISFTGMEFNFSALKEWSSGTSGGFQREFVIDAPLYGAAASAEFFGGITVNITGAPSQAGSMILDFATGLAIGDFLGSNVTNVSASVQELILPTGITNGVGHTASRDGLIVGQIDAILLGNQTATLDSFAGIRISQLQLKSTTNVRTVSDAWGMIIEGEPIDNGTGNVTISRGGSQWNKSGVARFDDGIVFNTESTLKHYVENTYSAAVSTVGGGGTVPVYSTTTARYTRIGNRVFVDVYFSGDGGAEGSGTDILQISLPISSSSTQVAGNFPCGQAQNGSTTRYLLTGSIATSSDFLVLESLANVSDSYQLQNFTANDQNNSTRNIRVQFSYEVEN